MQEDEVEPDGYSWDFNTVGTLTENDGVYSGFDASNYLVSKSTTGQTFATSLDIKISFTTSSSLPSGSYYQHLLIFYPNNYACPSIQINDSKIYFVYSTNGSNSDSIEAPSTVIPFLLKSK